MSISFDSSLLKRNSFIHNASVLMAGNIIAQLVNFCSAPILTRLYTPSDFGIFSFITSTVATISIIASLGYEHAIVLSRNQRQTWDLITICLILVLAFTLSLAFLFGVGSSFVRLVFDLSMPTSYLQFITLGILMVMLHQITILWMTREELYFKIALGQVLNQGISAGVKIGAVLTVATISPAWLVWGYLSGLASSFCLLAANFPAQNFWKYLRRFPLNSLQQTALQYSAFPKFHPWARLLDTFSRMLPIFLFASLYGAEIVGYYGLAFAVLTKPATVISSAVGRVFYQKAAAHQNDFRILSSQLKKATLILAAAGFFPFLLIAIKGEFLFNLIFGQAWSSAGYFAQLLTPAVFVSFVLPPANHMILVINLLKFKLTFSVIILLLRFVVILVAGYIWHAEPWMCVFGFSLVGALSNSFFIGYSFFKISHRSNV